MFGKRLALERERLGLSQSDCAAHLGVSRSVLAMIETDRTALDIQRLVDIAEKIGVDPIFILTGEPTSVAASKLMDWDLVLKIHVGVCDWCAEHKISLSPQKQTLVLKLLYERFSKSGEDIGVGLDETLRLAA